MLVLNFKNEEINAMQNDNIVWDEKRIEEHEARKAALAERMAAIAAEKVAIAKDEASMEAYEAEFLKWSYVEDRDGIKRWIHRDTLREALKSDQPAPGNRRTSRLRGRRRKALSK